jgi:VanZ family protein
MKRYQGALVVCALLIAYASLYPFIPLRPPGEGAVSAFFFKPRSFIAFDFALNVLAYVPLGVLASHRFRQAGARTPLLRALMLAIGLSVALEICQLFVPHRVASIVDVAANVVGAALGAAFFLEPLYSVVSRPLGDLRDRLFASGIWGDAGLVLIVLWLLAQLNPALPFFGAGNVVEDAAHGASVELLHGIAAGLSICAFALYVSALMRGTEGSLRATLVLLSIALWLKFVASSFMLKPHFSMEWVGAGRVIGLVAGILAFIPMRKLGRLARTYLAILFMLAGALFAKIFGAYSAIEELLRLFAWPHGQLAGFATLTRFLHELWPFAALVFLIGLFFHTRKITTLLERTQTLESRNFR